MPVFFTSSGTLRAYVFQRLNRVGQNQRAWNFGGSLHGEATLKSRPFTIGATYSFADPLGTNGSNPQHNSALDNSLPAYSIRALSELYAQVRTWRDFAQLGTFGIDTPFANTADKRMVPITFQGVQARHYFGGGWNISAMHMARFKSRTSSTFDANTLLTTQRTSGFSMVEVSHGANNVNLSIDRYWFCDIADLSYLSGQWTIGNSTLSAQTVIEDQAGRALVGRIHDHTYGMQFATRIGDIDASLGFDYAPGNGTGIMSPYTDGVTADPLFTTSLATSQSDRRSPGTSWKLSLGGTVGDGHIPWTISQAHYNFDSAGIADETDGDVALNLGRIDPTKLYMGLSLHQRWGYRITNTAPLRFLYSRTQLQYTF